MQSTHYVGSARLKQPKRYYYKDLIIELTRKELAVRYKHMAFGYIWSISSPLAHMAVYYLVFQVVLKVTQPNFALFLVAGLYPWQWISNSINVAPTTFLANTSLIKKTLFPRYLLPLVVVVQDAIHFALTIPIILIMLLCADMYPSIHWLWGIPLLIANQFLIAYSFNLLIASITLFFRDLARFVEICMTFLFYLTPILYSESKIPVEYQKYIMLNPIASLLINWRNIFLNGSIDPNHLLVSLAWGLVLLITCQWVYNKLSWRFAEVL